jgi:YVTN family beta-propeller protein
MVIYPKSVAVAPDGRSVWVTGPIPVSDCPDEDGGKEDGYNLPPNASEEIVILDPMADTVMGRIPVPKLDSTHLHLVQVAIDRDSRFAYVVANGTSQVVRVDMETRQIVGRVDLGLNRDPQSLSLCDDRAVVANAAGRSLSVVDLTRGTVEEVPLDGVAVRAVCSADGAFAYATVYDRKEVVRYEFATGALTRWPLPKTAAGPTQVSLSVDGKRLYVLDQGTMLNWPNGDKLYEVDAQNGKVRATIQVGRAPRGLVLSGDGKTAYTANYYDAGITVVDLASRKAVATVRTGIAPNGVGVWVNPEPLVQ